MKPPPFEYFAPRTVREIVDLLAQHGDEGARVLAGGQSLIPILNLRIMRPPVLIDMNQCAELDYIEMRGAYVAIGPMTRQLDTMKSSIVRTHCPLVSMALEWTGPVAVRSRATVGGTLAHADRVAELSAVAVALDAVMVIEGVDGQREVAASEFFQGDLTTAVEPTEFLREVRFPICEPGAFSHFSEVSVRQEGVAVVGLAVYLVRDGARVKKVAIAAMGVGDMPVRLRSIESGLLEQGLGPDSIEKLAVLASSEVDAASDPYASAAYREHVMGALVRRSLRAALSEESK